MKLTASTAKLSQLVRSPLQARDAKAERKKPVAELAASIETKGLINPLTVHKLKSPKGKLGVLAGEGRWLAIQALHQDGKAFDYDAIPVSIAEGTDAELAEISLDENEIREDLSPVERYKQFRAIREMNPDISDAELARRRGFEPARIARIMRLAYLHPTVFAAYERDELTDEQAFAYAATDDQTLQLQTFELLATRPKHAQYPRDIRAAMGVGKNEMRAMLAFVGIDAYQAAGGAYTIDLFAQAANSGIVQHEEILRRLANDKLEVVRAAAIAEHEATGGITFVESAPTDKYGSSWDFRVQPQQAPLTDEQAARLAAIDAREQAIEDTFDANGAWWDEFGEVVPDHAKAVEALEKEAESLRDEAAQINASVPMIIPDGPKLAVLSLTAEGVPDIKLYWNGKVPKAAGGDRIPASKPELGDKAVAALRQMRVNMLGGHIFETYPDAANTRRMAHDALIYSLFWAARCSLGSDYWSSGRPELGMCIGFEGSLYRTMSDVEPYDADLSDVPGLAAGDPIDGFCAYHHEATAEQKDRVAAWVYVRKVDGVLFKEGRRTIPEYIGTPLWKPLNARRVWQPSEAFFGLFRKDKILGWFGEIHHQFHVDRSKDKSADLKRNAAAFFAASDDAVTRFQINTTTMRVRDWLPEWLRWSPHVDLAPPAPPERATGAEDDNGDDQLADEDAEDDSSEFDEAAE